MIYQLDQLLLLSSRPSMSSAKRKFVIVLPLILTVPSWSLSALAIILFKKMLKRVGENTHLWQTPTVVQNHSPMLLSWQAALVALL